jgi:hypothetical protein
MSSLSLSILSSLLSLFLLCAFSQFSLALSVFGNALVRELRESTKETRDKREYSERERDKREYRERIERKHTRDKRQERIQ